MNKEIRALYISHIFSVLIYGAIIAFLCLKFGTANGELLKLQQLQHVYMPKTENYNAVDTTDNGGY